METIVYLATSWYDISMKETENTMPKKNSLFKLEMLILAVLKEKEYYGYELVQSINKLTEGYIVIKEGTLYPILYSLQNDGYITSTEQIIKRKVRVYYKIMPQGIEHYDQLVVEYKRMLKAIDKITKIGDS